MNRQFLVTLGALIGLGGSVLWGGDPRQIELRWDELAPRIDDRKVALVLPGGTHIKGKVEGVDRAALRLKVTGTSDRKAMQKGSQSIPRDSVSVIEVTEYRAIARPLCALGAAAVVATWVATSAADVTEGPVVILRPVGAVTGGALGALGGYYAGKALDKKVTLIRIVRDDRPRSQQ
jgi:hypothetical protein